MTIRQISVPEGLSDWTQRTLLDGREYVLRFVWNTREERWYMTISDQDEVVIAAGIKVVADWPLNRLLTSDAAPPGRLIAVDTSGSGEAPGLTDLGQRVLLAYVEAADIV